MMISDFDDIGRIFFIAGELLHSFQMSQGWPARKQQIPQKQKFSEYQTQEGK